MSEELMEYYEEMREKDRQMVALQQQMAELEAPRLCRWSESSYESWETECGHKFQFLDGGPTDNGFTHCPYCGGTLAESKADQETGGVGDE